MSDFHTYSFTSIFASCTGLAVPPDVCRRRVAQKSTTMIARTASSLSHLIRGWEMRWQLSFGNIMEHSLECSISKGD